MCGAHDTTPTRIQATSRDEWTVPRDQAVYVGRPTRWGNPYHHKDASNPDLLAAHPSLADIPVPERLQRLYEIRLLTMDPKKRRKILRPLRGKILVCRCALDYPCHADILLRFANQEEAPE